ncbi:MAG: hypothetical protein QGH50_21140 [SAR324 cluster bacterium]|nr:hypothetical protein [SAR324 cluster bacterium]
MGWILQRMLARSRLITQPLGHQSDAGHDAVELFVTLRLQPPPWQTRDWTLFREDTEHHTDFGGLGCNSFSKKKFPSFSRRTRSGRWYYGIERK